MSHNELRQKIEEKIRKKIFSYAFFRPESAGVIALTILLAGLSAFQIIPGIPSNWWWLWLIFGLAGEGLLLYSSLKDEKFYQQLFDELFQQAFDLSKLQDAGLRAKLTQALEYRQAVITEIQREEDPVLDDYLLRIGHNFEDWLAQLYQLAIGLDHYWQDQVIARDMKTIPQELAHFKASLAKEKQPSVQAALQETIATKEAQWQTLSNLQETMARAKLQIENTLSTMGTVYMQIRLLGAKDVDSDRARRLQEDMSEQVLALEDIQAAMAEVYELSSSTER